MGRHAVIVVDATGTIRQWNPGAEDLFGHRSEQALGKSLDLIVPESLRHAHWQGFRRAMQAPKVKDLAADLPVLCSDGEIRNFAGRLLVICDGLGEALGAVAVFVAEGSTGNRPFG